MQIHSQNLKPTLVEKKQFIETEFNKYKTSADFVAFKYVKELTRDLTVRNGKPDDISLSVDQGLLIEVMKNGHIGYAATCEITATGIQRTIEKALQMTEVSSKVSLFPFNLAVRPKSCGEYISPRRKSLDQISTAEIYDFLKKTSLQMKKNKHVITSTADAMIIECDQVYISSVGTNIHQNFNIVVNAFSATAQEGSETQTRSHHGGRGNCLQIGAEHFNLDQALSDCDLISTQVSELLQAENCPHETCDLILAPDQMLLQIHESIGHPLELDRILGDERNFAGWSFVQPEDFGKLEYGSPIMNVVFDPTAAHELASYKFDEVGNPAEKKYLIKDGVLVAALGSLESQQRSKIPGVANSRSSSWNRAPIDRMANINLEGGNLTFDEMVSKIERGVLMHSNRSWSIDDYRRKFQFGCEYGQLIENGQITKVLKNPNYRGVTIPFWKNLAGLTQDKTVETYGSPYCGKGEPSQIIRVGHSSPYAHFKNIEVFGA